MLKLVNGTKLQVVSASCVHCYSNVWKNLQMCGSQTLKVKFFAISLCTPHNLQFTV